MFPVTLCRATGARVRPEERTRNRSTCLTPNTACVIVSNEFTKRNRLHLQSAQSEPTCWASRQKCTTPCDLNLYCCSNFLFKLNVFANIQGILAYFITPLRASFLTERVWCIFSGFAGAKSHLRRFRACKTAKNTPLSFC